METVRRLLTTKEASERIGIDRSTLSRWVKSGRIKPSQRVGHPRMGTIVFDSEEIERFIRETPNRGRRRGIKAAS